MAASPQSPASPRGQDTVCLSLRVLQQLVVAARSGGPPLAADALSLAGIGLLDGYFVDPVLHDVVLLGRRTEAPLHLDDLIVSLASAEAEPPWCSLDPEPARVLAMQRVLAEQVPIDDPVALTKFISRLEDALGGQRTEVGGVPESSALAHTMVLADHAMKRIANGTLRVPGVPSAIEMQLAESRRRIAAGLPSVGTASMSRYWYHVGDGAPSFLFAEGIVTLAACPVVVLTEAQCAQADGKLVDGGAPDRIARDWTIAFSAALGVEGRGQVGRALPAAARLVALYRLVALTRALAERGDLATAGLDLRALRTEPTTRTDKPMVPTMPAVANVVTARVPTAGAVHVLAAVACGGVSMAMDTGPQRFDGLSNLARALTGARALAVAARPPNALAWVVKLPPLGARAGS